MLTDAFEMQKVLHNIVTKGRIAAHHKAACARAWETLAERVRILRNQPLPGQFRPEKEKKKKGAGKREKLEPISAGPGTPAAVPDCGVQVSTKAPDPEVQSTQAPK